MKTTTFAKTILTSILTIAVAALIVSPIASTASDVEKGATKQIQLNGSARVVVNSTVDAVMSCSACKNETVTSSTWGGKGAFEKVTTSTRHLCGECKNTVTTSGHGKMKTTRVSHGCGGCAS
jgi:hypothetical protein